MPGFEIFGPDERKEVTDVLQSGVLFRYGFDNVRNGHWKAKTFETELAKRLGSTYGHACSSGTAALSIALAVCGIGSGDEVIVPPFTFIATIEAVLQAGAIPIFAEIDETLGLDPDTIEAALSPRTKAVLIVHMCGAMARIDEITGFCRSKGLVLIEDVCQAIGASLQGKQLGTFGSMGCYSFDAVKTITCGEGGAIVTDDHKLYEAAQAYADHGHDHIGNDRGKEEHTCLGLNFRINELNAAVGLAQLRKLDLILERQRCHKQIIKDSLAELSGISFRQLPDPSGDSATFISFFMPDEASARNVNSRLQQAAVPTFYWYDNNWHYFRQWDHLKQLRTLMRLPQEMLGHLPDYEALELPRSDQIMSRTISLPIKLTWTQKDIMQLIHQIESVL